MKLELIGEPEIVMSNPDSKHNYFGWPTAVRLKNGRIAVGASGFRLYHICPFGKTVICFSEDEGKSYTAPMPVIDTCLDDRDAGLCTFGESGLIVTSFNNTVAFQREQNAKRKDTSYCKYIEAYLDTVSPENEQSVLGYTYRVSYDNGVTFGPIYKSPITSPHGPIELSNGSILWVGTSHANGHDIVAYEIDPKNGESKYIGKVNTDNIKAKGAFPCEPYAFETSDGRIICHIRGDKHSSEETIFTLYQTESSDGGRSWTTPVQILGDCGGAPSHIMRHSSGALVTTFSYRIRPYGIKAMISRDEGRSWSEAEFLYSNEVSGDLGYPSTVELRDGSLLTVFYVTPIKGGPASIMQQKWSLLDE